MTIIINFTNYKLRLYFGRLLLILMSLSLFACGVDNQELIDKIDEIKSRPGKPIAKIPSLKVMPKFTYPYSAKRRDPFYKFESNSKKTNKNNLSSLNAPNLKRKKQLLEQFNLKDLKMVGTLRRNSLVWGLVSAPDQIVHKVAIGGYLGQYYGRVVSINNKRIRLIETYKENKKWKKRDVNINLGAAKPQPINSSNLKLNN